MLFLFAVALIGICFRLGRVAFFLLLAHGLAVLPKSHERVVGEHAEAEHHGDASSKVLVHGVNLHRLVVVRVELLDGIDAGALEHFEDDGDVAANPAFDEVFVRDGSQCDQLNHEAQSEDWTEPHKEHHLEAVPFRDFVHALQ